MAEELHILWTNDNPVTSEKMVCMYAHNAMKRGWWDRITVIIWGAPALLAARDEAIRSKLVAMMKDGVTVSACRACAEELGVCNEIESLGIELKYWGEPLTALLKSGATLITV